MIHVQCSSTAHEQCTTCGTTLALSLDTLTPTRLSRSYILIKLLILWIYGYLIPPQDAQGPRPETDQVGLRLH